MEEKIYKIMRGAGALNIVLGVISLVVGIAAGVLLIISGGKLLRQIPHPVLRTKEKKGAVSVHRLGIST